MESGGLRDVIEAAYSLSVTRTTWLAGLGHACEVALGQGRGTVAALIDATDVRCARILDYATTRPKASFERVLSETVASLDPAYVQDSVRAGASLATEMNATEQPGLRMWLDFFGARDLLTVLAMDPSGVGAIVAVNLNETTHTEPEQRRSLGQVAAHVLGAYHLREQPTAEDAAVFRTNGEMVSSSEQLRESEALADLGAAVRALEAFRDRRSDDVLALEQFTSRVDGAYSIVARVKDGPTEWVVAKRNPSTVLPLPASLSVRENQVVSLLLGGRTQKMVAYELGIAHSTVRVLLSRAFLKLDVKSVKELSERFSPPAGA